VGQPLTELLLLLIQIQLQLQLQFPSDWHRSCLGCSLMTPGAECLTLLADPELHRIHVRQYINLLA